VNAIGGVGLWPATQTRTGIRQLVFPNRATSQGEEDEKESRKQSTTDRVPRAEGPKNSVLKQFEASNTLCHASRRSACRHAGEGRANESGAPESDGRPPATDRQSSHLTLRPSTAQDAPLITPALRKGLPGLWVEPPPKNHHTRFHAHDRRAASTQKKIRPGLDTRRRISSETSGSLACHTAYLRLSRRRHGKELWIPRSGSGSESRTPLPYHLR